MSGQGVFPRPELIPLDERPTYLAQEEVNGDGRPDLIAAHSSSGEITVFLNEAQDAPDQIFEASRTYAVELSPVFIATGDLDGENGPDLVVANSGSASLSVFRNRGDGTFRSPSRIATRTSPRVIVVADFDRDRKLDLVVGCASSREVDVYLGRGDGTFKSGESQEVGGNPHLMVPADFDGDGRLDLAILYANSLVGAVQWVRGKGDGAFYEPITTGLGSVGDPVPRFGVAEDFSGDGKPDLAVLTDESILLSLQFRSSGVFDVKKVDELPIGEPDFLRAAEFTGDGKVDLFVPTTDRSDSGLRIYEGRGDGRFQVLGEVFTGGPLRDVALGDFDEDGILDVVGAQANPKGLSVVRGTGIGRLGLRTSVSLGAGPRDLRAADLDGDGAQDVVAVSSGAVHLLRPGKLGALELARKVSFSGRALQKLEVGKLGTGGRIDLALLDLARSQALIVPVEPDLKLGEAVEVDLGGVPVAFSAGDVDRDGVLDLAVASSGSKTVVVWLHPGDRERDRETLKIPLASSPTLLLLRDLDGDGAPELVTGQSDGAHIWKRAGSPQEYVDVLEVAGSTPGALEVARVDPDPFPDLVVCSGKVARVYFTPLHGGGGDEEPTEVTVSKTISAVAVRDINGDGAADLALAADETLYVSLQGGGGFRAPQSYPIGGAPRAVALAPFNREGRMDCVTADFDSQRVSLLAGRATVVEPRVGFLRGDIDRDGRVIITDTVVLLEALFRGAPTPECEDAADANDDADVNISDAVFLLNYLFRGGDGPPAPGSMECGVDPTLDGLPDCPDDFCP